MGTRNVSAIPSRLPNGKKNPAYDTARHLKNHDKELAQRIASRPRKAETYRAWAIKNKAKISAQRRNRELLKKYGMTRDSWDEVLRDQEGKCKACGRVLDLTNMYNVHTDHNHATGSLRGIVCNRCNLYVGIVESPLYPAYIAYLEKNK